MGGGGRGGGGGGGEGGGRGKETPGRVEGGGGRAGGRRAGGRERAQAAAAPAAASAGLGGFNLLIEPLEKQCLIKNSVPQCGTVSDETNVPQRVDCNCRSSSTGYTAYRNAG